MPNAASMTAARFLSLIDRADRRRRLTRPWPSRLHPAAFSLALTAAVVGWILYGIGAFGEADSTRAIEVSRHWLTLTISLHVLQIFMSPFRVFWNRDATLALRLPIAGRALVRVAFWRSLRATLYISLPCVAGALTFAYSSPEIAARHLAVVAIAVMSSAVLAPALTLAAGAIVASSITETLTQKLAEGAGELAAPPKTTWLGLFPGLLAAQTTLLMISFGDWIVGYPTTTLGDGWLIAAIHVGIGIAAGGVALMRGPNIVLPALRETAALDRERFAHIERVQASFVEKLWSQWFLRSDNAPLIFDKDARVARRRFPIPYFLCVVAMVALWLVALIVPDALVTWAASLAAFITGYIFVMTNRRASQPIEHPRLLTTLPISRQDIVSAKSGSTILSTTIYLGFGGIPIVVRTLDWRYALGLAVLMTATIVYGRVRWLHRA